MNEKQPQRSKSSMVQFMTFFLGNELFGVDTLHVQEILTYHKMTPVPCAPEYVKGLLNHPQSLLSLSVTRSPILTRLVDLTAFEGEELVAAFSPLLPHKITKGYSTQPATLGVLSHVNDIEVKNLAHLVNTLRDAQDEFIVFSFDNLRSEKYVFRRHDIEAATEDILSDNGIRHQCSKELRHLWRGFAD